MPKQTKKEKILNAALTLTSDQPWEDVAEHHIAEKAGLSLDDYKEYFEDKMDLINFWHHTLDKAMCAAADSFDSDIETKDALFDLFMERFDALNENREASLSILRYFKQRPENTILCIPFVSRSMLKLAEAARLSLSGYKRTLVLSGLGLIYLKVLYAWENDNSHDMDQTMAALDKTLKQTRYFAQYLNL